MKKTRLLSLTVFVLFIACLVTSCNQEIKRLTNLKKKEADPLEQAKIANKIRALRMGE